MPNRPEEATQAPTPKCEVYIELPIAKEAAFGYFGGCDFIICKFENILIIALIRR